MSAGNGCHLRPGRRFRWPGGTSPRSSLAHGTKLDTCTGLTRPPFCYSRGSNRPGQRCPSSWLKADHRRSHVERPRIDGPSRAGRCPAREYPHSEFTAHQLRRHVADRAKDSSGRHGHAVLPGRPLHPLLTDRWTTAKTRPVDSPHMRVPVNASSGASIRHGSSTRACVSGSWRTAP